jgi:small subunit ribosomal protein S5
MAIINHSELDLREESVIRINRVAKVNSRGNRFSFSSLVVIGDGKSYVGIGSGKATEVLVSISKAKDDAKQNLVKIPVINYTIPHEVIGKHGASKVLLKPAPYGTGIIAGSSVRLIMEQVGVNNIYSKVLGSNNAMNVAKATMNALNSLQDVRKVAKKRGKTPKTLFEI